MRKLEAKEGMVLTQAAEIPVERRVFTKELYLAVNDSSGNWTEITESEANAIRTEAEKVRMEVETVSSK